MEKPNALSQVLDDLRQEGGESSATTSKSSRALIYLTAGGDPITLNREECELLLNTTDTVESLFDALGSPVDAAIELHHVGVEDEVQDALERTFSAVDEG